MADKLNYKSAAIGAFVAALVPGSAPLVADIGAPVIIGATNTGSAETEMQSKEAGFLVRIDNNNETGVAARFEVKPGNLPISVNSDARVKNLNADKLDGRSSGAYMRKTIYDSDKNGQVDDAATVMGLGPDDLIELPTNCSNGDVPAFQVEEWTCAALPAAPIMDSGTCTWPTLQTSVTCTFNVTFGSAPIVVVTRTNNQISVPWISSTGTSSFTMEAEACQPVRASSTTSR